VRKEKADRRDSEIASRTGELDALAARCADSMSQAAAGGSLLRTRTPPTLIYGHRKRAAFEGECGCSYVGLGVD